MSPGLRLAVFISIVLGVWTLQHLYVGWRAVSIPWLSEPAPRRLVLISLAIGWLVYPLGRTLFALDVRGPGWTLEYIGSIWMGALFLMVAALIVTELITVGGTILRPQLPILRSLALGLALVASAAGVVGGVRAPVAIAHEIEVRSLPPEAETLKLVQISDLHLGTLIGEQRLKELISTINEHGPDLVAITGDLIDGDPGLVEELLPVLETLRAPRGVYAVLGNHEYYAGRERSRRLLSDAGFTVLDNQAVQVVPGVWIAGVPDARGSAQTGAPEAGLESTLAQAPEHDFVVLLQHSPQDELRAAAAGADLMLNGHTHGGQIWPFHYLVRAAYPHYAGRYQVGEMVQIVSRGAGRWGPPMRLFAPADIVVVTLRPARP